MENPDKGIAKLPIGWVEFPPDNVTFEVLMLMAKQIKEELVGEGSHTQHSFQVFVDSLKKFEENNKGKI